MISLSWLVRLSVVGCRLSHPAIAGVNCVSGALEIWRALASFHPPPLPSPPSLAPAPIHRCLASTSLRSSVLGPPPLAKSASNCGHQKQRVLPLLLLLLPLLLLFPPRLLLMWPACVANTWQQQQQKQQRFVGRLLCIRFATDLCTKWRRQQLSFPLLSLLVLITCCT